MIIAERTLVTRKESLDIIQARFDRGTVALIDVNQAQIEMYDAEAQLFALQRDDVEVQNLLSILLGQHPGAIVRKGADIFSLDPLNIPAGLPSELLEFSKQVTVTLI